MDLTLTHVQQHIPVHMLLLSRTRCSDEQRQSACESEFEFAREGSCIGQRGCETVPEPAYHPDARHKRLETDARSGHSMTVTAQ